MRQNKLSITLSGLTLILVGGLFAGCTQSYNSATANQVKNLPDSVQLTGTITEYDTSEMAVDGPAIIRLSSTNGARYTIYTSNGDADCLGKVEVDLSNSLNQNVAVYAKQYSDTEFGICESEHYYIKSATTPSL